MRYNVRGNRFIPRPLQNAGVVPKETILRRKVWHGTTPPPAEAEGEAVAACVINTRLGEVDESRRLGRRCMPATVDLRLHSDVRGSISVAVRLP